MTGEELLAGLPHQHLQGELDIPCDSIAYDSRRVTLGSVFVALKGALTDGHDHVQDAAQRGAALVITEQQVKVPTEIAVVQVSNSRLALAVLAATFYGQPARSLNLIGITGTNGKTSVAFMLRHLLQIANRRCDHVQRTGSGNAHTTTKHSLQSTELTDILGRLNKLESGY